MTGKFTPPESRKDKPYKESACFYKQMREQTIETLEGRVDQFLENPPKQPKKTIVEYMGGDENIFSSFNKVKRYLEFNPNAEIVVRSEHPQEYNKASGLLKSYTLTKKDFDRISLQEDFEATLKEKSRKDVEYYCQLTGQDFDAFYSKISYSYWKKIPGINRSIVADSAIPNRYHIFTNKYDSDDFPPYIIIENHKIVYINSDNFDKSKIEQLTRKHISFYEEKRSLSKFNPEHCPVIEFQTDKKDNLHPLQYHRTREFEPEIFTLDREVGDGEVEATFTRGATSPEGEVFNVLINNQVGAQYYCDNIHEDRFNYDFGCLLRELYGLAPKRPSPEKNLEQISKTSIEPSHIPNWGQNATIIDTECRSSIFEEIMSRRNELSILLNDTKSILYGIGNNHISKSAITNSRLSIGLPYDFINQHRNDFTRGIKLRVISDGRKAYARRFVE